MQPGRQQGQQIKKGNGQEDAQKQRGRQQCGPETFPQKTQPRQQQLETRHLVPKRLPIHASSPWTPKGALLLCLLRLLCLRKVAVSRPHPKTTRQSLGGSRYAGRVCRCCPSKAGRRRLEKLLLLTHQLEVPDRCLNSSCCAMARANGMPRTALPASSMSG